MQSRDMNLVLSTDAKPRLKWTPELHQRFVDAVNQLGGAEKATPKSLMRAMGITGLTLYHLKSHLQKYRLGKSQQCETKGRLKLGEKEIGTREEHLNGENGDEKKNEMMKIWEGLEMQIEVQRHLQVRIEAQGKYLQTVLRKAQETIAGYGCCSEALAEAQAELSHLASVVTSGSYTSSLSELADSAAQPGVRRRRTRTRMCSLESSITSSQTTEFDLNGAASEDTHSDAGIRPNGDGIESQLIQYL